MYSLPQIAKPTSAVHPSFGMPPQRLAVSILQAHGLHDMDISTSAHTYCKCEAVRLDGHIRSTRVETERLTHEDMRNPFWGETRYLESWHPGESLQFTVLNEGFAGSKTVGTALLPSEMFFPQGFGGMVQVAGLRNALLHVIVRPLGMSAITSTRNTTGTSVLLVEGAPQSGRGEGSLTVGKKSKKCC